MGKKTTTFAIDNENGITAYPTQKEAKEAAGESALFASQDQLEQATAGCTTSRLIDIWNGIPGVEPVKKFTSRGVAIGRIWKAIQSLAPAEAREAADVAPQAAGVAPEAPGPARKATAYADRRKKATKGEPRGDSKKAQVIAMLQRPGGVTLAAIIAATDWQAHTVRGFIATVPKKLGLEVVSAKVDGERTYSAGTAAATAGA